MENELWKSDGTVSGTVLNKMGDFRKHWLELAQANRSRRASFSASLGPDTTLKSDGTVAETILRKDIVAGKATIQFPEPHKHHRSFFSR
ncbi:MAG: hypothetical protein U0936_27150 [Planctomycetaceae bacterium]